MKVAIYEEFTELNAIIRRKPYNDLAYFIMRRFMEIENPSENTRRNFYEWLTSPDNAQAKEEAMARCFEDMLV